MPPSPQTPHFHRGGQTAGAPVRARRAPHSPAPLTNTPGPPPRVATGPSAATARPSSSARGLIGCGSSQSAIRLRPPRERALSGRGAFNPSFRRERTAPPTRPPYSPPLRSSGGSRRALLRAFRAQPRPLPPCPPRCACCVTRPRARAVLASAVRSASPLLAWRAAAGRFLSRRLGALGSVPRLRLLPPSVRPRSGPPERGSGALVGGRFSGARPGVRGGSRR